MAEKRTTSEIARDHGCSEELVIYRIKRMRLWQRYDQHRLAVEINPRVDRGEWCDSELQKTPE
jgi:hypothetical protein